MSDRDNLIATCKHMGLKQVSVKSDDFDYLNPDEFGVDDGCVIIGEGEGYSGFYVRFEFDSEGRAIKHGVWE